MLELEAALPGRRDTLKVLGMDPFRAAALQPALIGDIGGGLFDAASSPTPSMLSSSAAQALNLRSGDTLQVIVGSTPKSLHVMGILSEGSYPQPLGIMDIASAQWTFEQARSPESHRPALESRHRCRRVSRRSWPDLPAGVLAIAPQVERDRAVSVTRAYRVNLNMLALVALWTGAFLVFSTQSLSVLRRRRSLALLRALGVTRGQLQRALIGEGAALGVAGSLLGVVLGCGIAGAILRFLAGDLGNGQLRAAGASLRAAPLPMLVFFVHRARWSRAAGAWLPARAAARQPPARALKGGDGDCSAVARASSWRRRWRCCCSARRCSRGCRRSRDCRLFGYAAIAALLFGAVLLVPALTVQVLQPGAAHAVASCPTRRVAQLRENVGLSTLEPRIHHRQLQPDGGHGHHGLFIPSVLRALAGQAAAGRSANARAASATTRRIGRPRIRQARRTVPGIARIEFRRTRPTAARSLRVPPSR